MTAGGWGKGCDERIARCAHQGLRAPSRALLGGDAGEPRPGACQMRPDAATGAVKRRGVRLQQGTRAIFLMIDFIHELAPFFLSTAVLVSRLISVGAWGKRERKRLGSDPPRPQLPLSLLIRSDSSVGGSSGWGCGVYAVVAFGRGALAGSGCGLRGRVLIAIHRRRRACGPVVVASVWPSGRRL